MRTAPQTRRVRSLGSTAAEFAVILPLAVTVMFGSIEAGRMVVSRMMLSYAVIEGGRAAGTRGTANCTDVEAAVINASPLLKLTAADIDTEVVTAAAPACNVAASSAGVDNETAFDNRTVWNGTMGASATSCVRVTVRYTFTPVIGLYAKTWTVENATVVQ